MTPKEDLVIYTDLDGTLLEEASYSSDAAAPALSLIRSLPVHLVLCTSKTHAEVLPIQQELGFQNPFIVENGGAIHLPAASFGNHFLPHNDDHEWTQIGLGMPYDCLVEFLSEARKELSLDVVGFHDLTEEEIAEKCGLSLEQARRAKRRDYDEPFFFTRPAPESVRKLGIAAAREGLTVTRGGRFHHLSGGCDKGVAVTMLTRIIEKYAGNVFTMGIGDSPNDLPMLRAVDLPILVQRPDGHYHPALAKEMEDARRAPGIGPTGWKQAVITTLRERDYL